MACDNWDNCVDDEMKDMAYPTDRTSLYRNKIYDSQIASGRCYEMNPIRIMENFDTGSWSFWIVCLVILLLIVLIGFLFKDYMYDGKMTGGGFDLESPSEFNLASLNLI